MVGDENEKKQDAKETQGKEGNGQQGQEEKEGQRKAEAGAGIDDAKERLLRLAAEFDNYKKRVSGEIVNAKNLGKAELLRDFLPILDEFELALIAVSKADNTELAKGIELLYSNVVEFLKKEGVKEVRTEGIYDPFMHEIALTRESDKKQGTILEVIKRGYTLNNALLRPAMVIVASDGGKEPDKGKKDN